MSLSPRLLKVPTPENCQSSPYRAEGGACELVVADIVHLHSARIAVAQDHVAFCKTRAPSNAAFVMRLLLMS
jgi:hypothetical protein